MPTLMFAIAGVLLLVLGLLGYTILPWLATRKVDFPDYRFDAKDKYRQTVAGALGGAAVLLTFLWTFEKDRETMNAAQEQEAGRQYLESAKLLGETGAVAAHSAAVFGLGKVANTTPSFAVAVRETLVAFVRAAARSPGNKDPSMDGAYISSDTQSALLVLGQRSMCLEEDVPPLALDNADLRGAVFYQSWGFSHASLQGARLQGTDFRGAVLDGTKFNGAQSGDYQGYTGWNDGVAQQPGWGAWRKYYFVVNFEGADLREADFTGAVLTGSTFRYAHLQGAVFLGADLSRVDFRGASGLDINSFGKGPTTSACADVAPLFTSGSGFSLRRCDGMNKPPDAYPVNAIDDTLSCTKNGATCIPAKLGKCITRIDG